MMVLGIAVTFLVVLFGVFAFSLNASLKEIQRNNLELKERIEKQKQKDLEHEKELREKNQIKESLETGNGPADFAASVDLLHQLAGTSRTGRKD